MRAYLFQYRVIEMIYVLLLCNTKLILHDAGSYKIIFVFLFILCLLVYKVVKVDLVPQECSET
jgi:hypothetical protein